MNKLSEKLIAIRDMFGPHSLNLSVEQMMRIRRVLSLTADEAVRMERELEALTSLAEKPAVIAAMQIDADPEVAGLLQIAADVRREERRQAAVKAATPIEGTNLVTFPIARRPAPATTDGDAA